MTEHQFLEIAYQHQVQVYQHILYPLGNREDAKDITESTTRQKIGESFMQRLFKCEFYFMTLLATVLLLSGIATGNDQPASKADTQQITQKPTIMILGSEHLSNPGMDGINTKMDDVLAPKRQREIQQLVKQLKAFQPTKIALEVDPRFDAKINANYQGYLEGSYELKRGEGDQIGFRLAKQIRHSKVYCVDFFRNYSQEPDGLYPENFDWDLVDSYKFAKAHNQKHLLSPPPVTEGKIIKDKDGTTWIEPEKYEPIIDMYIRLNEPEGRLTDHQQYLRSARIGLGAQYPGANWVGHLWYTRNLKIFANLTRITESADDRILLIIGAGHVYLIQQFLEESGDYIIENSLKYLKADDTEKPVSETD